MPVGDAGDQRGHGGTEQELVDPTGQQRRRVLPAPGPAYPPQRERCRHHPHAPPSDPVHQPGHQGSDHVEVHLGRERPEGDVEGGGQVHVEVLLQRHEAAEVGPAGGPQQIRPEKRDEHGDHGEVRRQDAPDPASGEVADGVDRRAGPCPAAVPRPDDEEAGEHEEGIDPQPAGADPPPERADVGPAPTVAGGEEPDAVVPDDRAHQDAAQALEDRLRLASIGHRRSPTLEGRARSPARAPPPHCQHPAALLPVSPTTTIDSCRDAPRRHGTPRCSLSSSCAISG